MAHAPRQRLGKPDCYPCRGHESTPGGSARQLRSFPGSDPGRSAAAKGVGREAASPDRSTIDTAARIVGLTPVPSLYARVDGYVAGGRFVLMELELIEPVLFLAQAPEAAPRLADEISLRLGSP